MDGFLLVDKPEGWTSFDAVARIRRIIKEETGQKVKVGHTGTLDPAATGLLIIVVGSYCKRAAEFSKLDKTYQAEITLGATSSTGDSEGIITKTDTVNNHYKNMRSHISVTQITEVLELFMGEIQQIPPAFSAIKVDGQRAYKLARQGEEVKLKPRKVKVYSIQLEAYSYPKLSLRAEVSSGTYIRSLAEDIGTKLGTGAYLSALRRTKVDKFDIDESIDAKLLDHQAIETNLKSITPIDR